MKIGIVDYNAGNLTSVVSAISHIGANYLVSSSKEELLKCDKIIFPGVGEAKWAMEELKKKGLETLLSSFVNLERPVLGICLGSQIILDYTEESSTKCLGLVPGEAKKFPSDMGLKIPHIGWNTIEHSGLGVFRDIPLDASFYFVHSYYVTPKNREDVIGTTNYGIDFCSALSHGYVTAFQFHPEKSGEVGLRLLRNFINFI
jgi:imidazole glycerol-phosphate synthase subunit HisH